MKRNLLLAGALLISGALTAQTTILTEDFEGGALPSGWTRSQATGADGWLFGNAAALSSQYWAIGASNTTLIAASNDDECNCNSADDRLITPGLNLTASSAVILQFDAYYTGAYGSLASVDVSTNGGTTWTNVADLTASGNWQQVSVNLSAYAGQSGVLVAFHHDDDGVWADGFAIDNVNITEPAALDMGVTNIAMISTYGLNNAPIDVEGTITNFGSTAITSFTLNYTINGGAAVAQNVTGVNIPTLGTYNFTHATQWNPTVIGNYNIEIYATNLNGSVDANTANDAMDMDITVVTATTERTVLYEQFTSSTCGPCAAVAPAIKALMLANDANEAGGRVAAIKYQMDYPSPGTDPIYNSYSDTRHTYYGVGGIPNASVDGDYFNDHPAYVNQAMLDYRKSIPSLVELNLDASYNGGNISVDCEINPLGNISGTLRLHLVVTEDQVNHNVQTNGETEFYYVQRTMLPSAAGNNVAALTAGTPVTVSQTKSMTINSTPAANQTANLYGDMTNVTVIAFLQNNTTQEVYQAAFIKPTFLNVEDLEANELAMEVFPNPANDEAQVILNIENDNNVTIEVMDMSGKLMSSMNLGIGYGPQYVRVNTADLPNGLYLVRVQNNGKVAVKTLSVSH